MRFRIKLIIPTEYYWLYRPSTIAAYLARPPIVMDFPSLNRAKEVCEYGLNAHGFRYERSGNVVEIFGKKQDLDYVGRKYKEYHLGTIEILN